MDEETKTQQADPIPKTCSECIKSKYKLQKPQCAHEQGLEHKKTYEYFKTIYGTQISPHLDMMQRLKRQREVCLRQIQDQATRIIALRRALDIDNILGRIGTLTQRINEVEDNGNHLHDIEDKNRILAAPKEQIADESYVKKVIKKESQPILKAREEVTPEPQNNKIASLKERGWLMYVRNVKKDKIEEYIDRLRKEYPDLADNQIKISVNKTGNYMIRYTLNPNIAE